MKALVVSDMVVPLIYSPAIRPRFGHVDLVISCGDLPYYYIEYITSMLDRPTFFVRGNHANVVEYSQSGPRSAPQGATDLDRRVIDHEGLLMAGLEGSIRYSRGPFQYTNNEMRVRIAHLLPTLFLNRARRGRFLDVLVTHSPPRHVQDQEDRSHQGFVPFRWFLRRFRPRYMLHGHIHIYHPGIVTRSRFHQTEVINCYSYREVDLGEPPDASKGPENDERARRPRRL